VTTTPQNLDDDFALQHGQQGIAQHGAAQHGYVWLVVSIIVVACALRFVALDRYPLPVHQDELSNIYDGYSIAQTGADRAGTRFPIIVRGMGPGDYRPAMYAYFAAATTGLFGFSTWAGRLPAALLGSLTVVLIFLAARSLFGKRGAVIALVLATFSPILIQYGRQAHEGACLPPFERSGVGSSRRRPYAACARWCRVSATSACR